MLIDYFFRARLDEMIDLQHPLVVLANRLPWFQIEAALAIAFKRKNRQGQVIVVTDLFGTALTAVDTGITDSIKLFACWKTKNRGNLRRLFAERKLKVCF